MSEDLSFKQKSAAVVIALGADRASKVYKFLNDSELEELTYQIAKINQVSAGQTEEALDDFYKMCITQKVVTSGGIGYAKEVLEKAFGVQVASSLLDRISRTLQVRAFSFIREADSKNIYALIKHEHPQTIALILSYARPEQAADVIAELPKSKRALVVERIAKMDRASPAAIHAVESVLQVQFASVMSTDFAQIGGIDYIADVLNNMDRSNEKFIFDELNKRDTKLAEDIHNKMFVFEDIILLDNRAVQKFVNEVEVSDLVYSLKGATPEVANVLFSNMSSRKAEAVQADLEVLRNVRMKDIEEAQQRIVAVIRRLEEEGELVTNKGGKDEVIA